MKFAALPGYSLIWIDKECIMQDDPQDKELGIQSMDLVYERAPLCVALLDYTIETQEQLNLLAIAMAKGPWPAWGDWHVWILNHGYHTVRQIADIGGSRD